MSRGEVTLQGLIIGLLLFSGVILGLISFENDLFSHNGVQSNLSDRLSGLDYINSTFSNTQEVQHQLEGATETNSSDYLGLLSLMTLQGLQMSFKSLGSYIVLIGSLPTGGLHIPVYVSAIIITILVITFVFIIASAVLRWRV